MTKIVKFPKDKIEYSDRFYRKVNPKVVANHIKMLHPRLSFKVAHAIALAVIYGTYVELVLDEEDVPTEIVDQVRKKDFKSFIEDFHGKRLN